MTIAVVTDSTASLPADLDVVVVPLQVVVGSQVHDESTGSDGDGASPELVAEAMREGTAVSTSRPAPALFAQAYAEAAAAGATGVVSVHLSGAMSGTVESARLAARDAPLLVVVVDTHQVGVATGYAAASAAAVASRDGSLEAAADAARARAAAASSLFYVDTLEHLRRGGRIGAAAALLGGALAVKPLLHIEDGRVAARERVRTASRALARLEELAVTAAGAGEVDVCVAHLASPERAARLVSHLSGRLAGGLAGRSVRCTEIGAVLGAHVGPGMLAVCVAPRLPTDL